MNGKILRPYQRLYLQIYSTEDLLIKNEMNGNEIRSDKLDET